VVATRRAFLKALTGGLLAAPLAAEAQSTSSVRRIGVMGGGTPEYIEARKEGLRRLGWIEGQNIIVEQVPVGNKTSAQLQELARDLVRLKVEVIVANNNERIAAAKAVTTTIPIVMVHADDPVREGYVASLARPGGNITGGTFSFAPDVLGEIHGGKAIELLAECRPGLSRLALLLDPHFPSSRTFSLSLQAVARKRGMTVQAVEVREASELARAFARMVKDRVQAIQIIGSVFTYSVRGQIAELAVRHRLPTAYAWREGPEAGGLLSYGASIPAAWHRAAIYIDKILKGAHPADLPVEQPTTFELIINLKTAKVLGLTIPPSLLQRADHVIE
jgi:putative tryptophan/tyrosine transport system substrate-binding protein